MRDELAKELNETIGNRIFFGPTKEQKLALKRGEHVNSLPDMSIVRVDGLLWVFFRADMGGPGGGHAKMLRRPDEKLRYVTPEDDLQLVARVPAHMAYALETLKELEGK